MTSPSLRTPPTTESLAVLPLVLETALDGVVVMGTDGVMRDWNHQAESIFGWSRAEAVGRPLADLIIPEPLRQAHREGLDRFLKTGEGPLLGRRIEVTAIRKSGAEFAIELSISPVNMDGSIFFLGFIRDISERRRHEEFLKRQAREAEVLNHVTTLAAETESLDEILRLCLASVCELTGWPAGHAYLPQRGASPRLASSMIWHGDLSRFSALKAITEATTFGPGEGLPGRIWSRREPCWILDVDHSDAFPRAWLAEEVGVRSAFGFPIMSGGDVTAILEFFSHEAAELDPRLLHIVRALGQQVGRVLERRAVQERQALLLAELDHRAKNMLAVVIGMADQTARRSDSLESFQETFSARVGALARGYTLITASRWRTTSLEAIVREIVEPYVADGQAQMEMSGDAMVLSPKAALAVTMILHELVSNATKYGALSMPSGRINIRWAVSAGSRRRVELEWRETGMIGLQRPTRRGFGAKLIEATASRELGGDVTTEFAPEGVRYRFRFPEPDIQTAA
ncbi:PAS domain S-box protein [Phenylobacterium sp.]|uniref:PAS domain S-box protein n=1 Tax=Phenylobacterium sp. TaxID=1871053 RepID=UPI003BAB2674